MIEIQPSDLQVNQIYYIEFRSSFSIALHLPSKIKVICNEKIPANDYNADYVKFSMYTGVNSRKIHHFLRNCAYMNYRNYKYYLPTRDAILEKKEKNTVNMVLQKIIGDPSFTYY